jgi:hypothetical protein
MSNCKADEMFVRISLGNDAMMTSHHVAQALRAIAKRLEDNEYLEYSKEARELVRGVMDNNGQTVGEWGFR